MFLVPLNNWYITDEIITTVDKYKVLVFEDVECSEIAIISCEVYNDLCSTHVGQYAVFNKCSIRIDLSKSLMELQANQGETRLKISVYTIDGKRLYNDIKGEDYNRGIQVREIRLE